MGSDDLREQLISYLTDMHSTEENALQQLRTGADGPTANSPSALKDVAQKGGALLAGAVAKAAPDTTGKVAIQAYASEHLEIASYRMLRTVAEQAGDQQTVQVAERILAQERAAAEKLDGLLERVAIVSLPQAA